MKFIAGLRVWVNGALGKTPQVFPRIRGSANRRVDLHVPLIASIPGDCGWDPEGGGRLNAQEAARPVMAGLRNLIQARSARSCWLDRSLLWLLVGRSGILAEYQDPVVGDQDQVLAAVAVHVADDLVARLAHVADPAKELALEHLEGDGVEEILFSRVGRDLQHLLGDVGEGDIGDAVGVQVAGREVREPSFVSL